MSDDLEETIVDPEWTNFFRLQAQETKTLEESLSAIPIFSLLSDRELRLLKRVVHLRRYAAGETIIRRGVPQSGFYLIRSGSVEIVRQGRDGSREVVALLGPGELVGEFALFDGAPRSSSIVAAEPSELIGFFRPDLMAVLDTWPAMGCKILLRLGEEMARTLRQDYAALIAYGFPFPELDPSPLIDAA